MAIGRISGQLLKSNLLRAGENLAFETDLLYLDVVNSRIGVRTAAPTNDLHVNGHTRTTNLTVDNQINVGDLSFTGNTITVVLTLSILPRLQAKLQYTTLDYR